MILIRIKGTLTCSFLKNNSSEWQLFSYSSILFIFKWERTFSETKHFRSPGESNNAIRDLGSSMPLLHSLQSVAFSLKVTRRWLYFRCHDYVPGKIKGQRRKASWAHQQKSDFFFQCLWISEAFILLQWLNIFSSFIHSICFFFGFIFIIFHLSWYSIFISFSCTA